MSMKSNTRKCNALLIVIKSEKSCLKFANGWDRCVKNGGGQFAQLLACWVASQRIPGLIPASESTFTLHCCVGCLLSTLLRESLFIGILSFIS